MLSVTTFSKYANTSVSRRFSEKLSFLLFNCFQRNRAVGSKMLR